MWPGCGRRGRVPDQGLPAWMSIISPIVLITIKGNHREFWSLGTFTSKQVKIIDDKVQNMIYFKQGVGRVKASKDFAICIPTFQFCLCS